MTLDLRLEIGDTVQAMIEGRVITVKLLAVRFSFGALPGTIFDIIHTIDGRESRVTVTMQDLQSWFGRGYWTKVVP